MYTIRVKDRTPLQRLLVRLEKAVAKSRFTAKIELRDRDVVLPRVRLGEAKPYCGNHPGPCVVGPFGGVAKKRTTRWLEWDDWVEFHGIVNDVLDASKTNADVWSNPQDARGKFWMRRGILRRVQYDYEEEERGFGLPLRIWNTGTPDQFASHAAWEKRRTA